MIFIVLLKFIKVIHNLYMYYLIIPFTLVGYRMITANFEPGALLAIHYPKHQVHNHGKLYFVKMVKRKCQWDKVLTSDKALCFKQNLFPFVTILVLLFLSAVELQKRQFKSYINDQKKNVPDSILKVPASSMQMILRLKHTLSLNIQYFLFYQLLQWSDSSKAALELK